MTDITWTLRLIYSKVFKASTKNMGLARGSLPTPYMKMICPRPPLVSIPLIAEGSEEKDLLHPGRTVALHPSLSDLFIKYCVARSKRLCSETVW